MFFESFESRTLLSAAPLLSVHERHVQHLAHLRHAGVIVEAQPLQKSAPAVSNVLSLSRDRRSLVNSRGKPFFYLADTAWHLFDKTSRAEADLYLETRAAQGFTVIQAEVNARFRGNKDGDRAFVNNDPTRPNEAYFEYVDYVVNKANSLGMYVALVPLDSKWSQNGTFNVDNVYAYGRFLGGRYAKSKIIWVLGGDVPGDKGAGVGMWREMAYGLARGAANRDQSKVTVTFHPIYGRSASEWFGNDEWLDFDSFQSGHGQNPGNYNTIAKNYAKSPARPQMDIESGYEDIPVGLQKEAKRLTAYDVRKAAYWSLFAGSFGVTYGNNNVWQFVSDPSARNLATESWKNSLKTAGATSMQVLRRLTLSRPLLGRAPDQSLIVGSSLGGGDHIQATRGGDSSYAFVYTASGKAVTVNLSKLTGTKIEARWYNPRKGKSAYLGTLAKSGNRTFTAPTSGDDWVLVLDDASKKYGKP
jgi:hypothetical protein